MSIKSLCFKTGEGNMKVSKIQERRKETYVEIKWDGGWWLMQELPGENTAQVSVGCSTVRGTLPPLRLRSHRRNRRRAGSWQEPSVIKDQRKRVSYLYYRVTILMNSQQLHKFKLVSISAQRLKRICVPMSHTWLLEKGKSVDFKDTTSGRSTMVH